MATDPKKAAAPAAASMFIVLAGVLVSRDPKGKTTEVGPGEPFTPADDEERDSLLKSGRIARRDSDVAKAALASPVAANAAADAVGRAEAAEAKVADLQGKLDAANARLAQFEAAASNAGSPPAATPTATPAAS